MGAPLLLGLGEHENFAASDTSALLQVTQKVIYLEEGDCAEVGLDDIKIVEKSRGSRIERPLHHTQLSAESVELGAYSHYMQKEIFEQPRALRDTLELAMNARSITPELFGTEAAERPGRHRRRADPRLRHELPRGLVARYWIESLAGMPCNVEIASEYRYRNTSVPTEHAGGDHLAIGRDRRHAGRAAADQEARLRPFARHLQRRRVALVRAASLRLLTRAGPEIGVASTKAFTTQLARIAAGAHHRLARGRIDGGARRRS